MFSFGASEGTGHYFLKWQGRKRDAYFACDFAPLVKRRDDKFLVMGVFQQINEVGMLESERHCFAASKKYQWISAMITNSCQRHKRGDNRTRSPS